MTDNVITPGPEPDVLQLALASFRRDESLWPRRDLDPDRVREFRFLYEQNGPEALPPLLILQIDGRRFLADGWERCAAAEELGWTRLPARVRRAARTEDVYLEALAAVIDGDRPLPLTQVEKRAVVDRLLQQAPRSSDHGIARMAGVSQPFVSARRHRMEASGERVVRDPKSLPPSRREAGALIAAADRLARMERTLRYFSDGMPLDPATALCEAARRHGAAAAGLLARLERWAAQAQRELGGGGEPGPP